MINSSQVQGRDRCFNGALKVFVIRAIKKGIYFWGNGGTDKKAILRKHNAIFTGIKTSLHVRDSFMFENPAQQNYSTNHFTTISNPVL